MPKRARQVIRRLAAGLMFLAVLLLSVVQVPFEAPRNNQLMDARDIIVSSNVLRDTRTGIAVTVVKGSGTALISDNLIEAREGAIVGMEWDKRVTGDLTKDGTGRHAHLTLSGNRVR